MDRLVRRGFLPTLREALALQKPMDGLALSQAIWARMCEGSREDGSIIEPNDPFWPKLMDRARASKTNPQAWLNQTELYGDLGDNTLFRNRFHHWFNDLVRWTESRNSGLSEKVGGS